MQASTLKAMQSIREFEEDMVNITPFELIPYLLGTCGQRKLKHVKGIGEINLVNINFADELPLSPLHWMMSDGNEAIVV